MTKSECQQFRQSLEILAKLIARKVMREQADKDKQRVRNKAVDQNLTTNVLALRKEPIRP